jgi:hypothetical protein
LKKSHIWLVLSMTSGQSAHDKRAAQDVAVFTNWRDTHSRVSNHRFLGDFIEYFVDDNGWLSATDTPKDAKKRYWLSRDAVARVGDWPQPIARFHGVALSRERPGRPIALITEIDSGEEVFRTRPLHDVFGNEDLDSILCKFLETLVTFPER